MAVTLKTFWAVTALVILLISSDIPTLIALSVTTCSIYYIVKFTSLLQELKLLFDHLTMDDQAAQLLVILKNSNVPVDTKLDQLSKLKTHIKHHHVPESSTSLVFDVVRAAITSTQLLDAGFSILTHLTKRLELQDLLPVTASQGTKTYSLLVERLGDAKERVRLRAIQALVDFWKASHADVEKLVRDTILTGKSPRAKEAGMQWIVKMNQDFGLQFKSFVSNMVECLEDADGSVRDTAKATIIQLFLPLPDNVKLNLKKHLEQRNVRKTIVAYIYSQLGLSLPADLDLSSSIHTQESESSFKDSVLGLSTTSNSTHPTSVASATLVLSASEVEAEQLEPIYINSSRELEEIFRDMAPHFEGRESEQNWTPREKSIVKLRRITKGNAPSQFTTTFLVGIKSLLDGILKTVNSLRTTVSTNACHFIQDLARAAGPGLDMMVEILLQSLIKLCGGTKTISAENGNATVDAILGNVTYNVRLMQHIWTACQDKNVRPRSYATGWLKTLITKHGHHRSTLEHANGLDLIDKCIKKGLNDASPGVREGMRATYWAYWGVWHDRADSIMQTLDGPKQVQLVRDSSNPDSNKSTSHPTSATGTKVPAFSRSVNAATVRPSLKETIAAKKQAKSAALERPGSAQPIETPARPAIPRPATAMAIGTLSSAPLRPKLTRPKTAVPKKENTPIATIKIQGNGPKTSPSHSINKKISPSNSINKMEDTSSNIPTRNLRKKSIPSPTKALEDLTMVIPQAKASTSNTFVAKGGSIKSLLPAEAVITEVPLLIDADELVLSSGASCADEPIKTIDASTLVASTETHLIADPTAAIKAPDLVLSTRTSPPPASAVAIDASEMVPSMETSIVPEARVTAETLESITPVETAVSPELIAIGATEVMGSQTLDTSGRTLIGRSVLGELPINHEGTPRSSEWGSEKSNASYNAERLLDSACARIRTKTLDSHGFRKLQHFISTNPDWTNPSRFEELLAGLCDGLVSQNSEKTKSQILVTIQKLQKATPELFVPLCSRALTSILLARSNYSTHSHFAAGLDETTHNIIYATDNISECIDTLLDSINSLKGHSPAMLRASLVAIADLMHRNLTAPTKSILGYDTEKRVADLAAGCMAALNVDVRMAAIHCVKELYDAIGEPGRFWGLIHGVSDADRNLLTYFFASRCCSL